MWRACNQIVRFSVTKLPSSWKENCFNKLGSISVQLSVKHNCSLSLRSTIFYSFLVFLFQPLSTFSLFFLSLSHTPFPLWWNYIFLPREKFNNRSVINFKDRNFAFVLSNLIFTKAPDWKLYFLQQNSFRNFVQNYLIKSRKKVLYPVA